MASQHVKIVMVFGENNEPLGEREEEQIKQYLEDNFEPDRIYVSYEDYDD